MYKSLAGIVLCLSAALAHAQDGPRRADGPLLPKTETLPVPRPSPGYLWLDDDRPRPAPLVELKANLLKLREQREALQNDHVRAAQYLQQPALPDAEETAKLRLRLGNLLAQIGIRKGAAPMPFPNPPAPRTDEIEPSPRIATDPGPPVQPKLQPNDPPPQTEAPAPEIARAIDPLALAQALFRAGNFESAMQAYRLVPQEGLKAEERAPLNYMIATCLRKLGKTEEAAALYREVANVRGDEVLAHCAQWQLNALRWHREITDQLKDVRQRRQALENVGSTP